MGIKSAIRPSETVSLGISVELLTLLDQYSELQLEEIATSDESWI
jgi:hypothetical protein